MAKQRADQMLVEQGLAESRTRAQALILAGLVYAGDRRVAKAGETLAEDASLVVKGRDHPWVSRGGVKLVGGLDHFGWDVTGAVALDVGASTGGFTDVLLSRGAVTAINLDGGGSSTLGVRLPGDDGVVQVNRAVCLSCSLLLPQPSRSFMCRG